MLEVELIILSICLNDLSLIRLVDRDLMSNEESLAIYDRLEYLYRSGLERCGVELLDEYRDKLKEGVSVELFDKYLGILKDNKYLLNARRILNKYRYFSDAIMELQNIIQSYCISNKEDEDIYNKYISTIESKNELIYTGFNTLDSVLGGLERSDLVIVAGRPSMGKTTFALSLMNKLKKYRVCFLSLEMSNIQLLHKLVGIITGLNPLKLKTGNLDLLEREKVLKAIEILKSRKYFLYDNVYSISDISSKLSNIEVDIIILDYLQLLCDSENRNLEISKYTRYLKLLAKEKNAVCILLSQLNRNVEIRAIKVPTLADLRDSGSIEQDADVVMFIYRDDYYNKDIDNDIVSSDIIIAKNRKGLTGKVELVFDKRDVSFKE